MEAPTNYQQEYLRPGCSVRFKIGESVEDLYPQITISLEDNGNLQTLLGKKYCLEQKE